jgi:dual specificity phosphatase 12
MAESRVALKGSAAHSSQSSAAMDGEYHHMDQILPGLWVGDLHSAKDADALTANNIHSILTVMRGRFSVPETFFRHQIPLDDVEDADVLQHMIPSITFIQAELDKGKGILVHCQAGTSRSATIAAAYIMYSQNVDASTAIDLIRKVRSSISPNAGFIVQLEIFHQASFKVSRRDKATRMFYLERAVEEILSNIIYPHCILPALC